MSLARSFWRHLSIDPARVVLERLEPHATVSWKQTRGELRREASHWMAALLGAGVQPGDRVAVSLGKSSGLVTGHIAVLGVGATIVPLNPSLAPRETLEVLRRADVRLAITHARTLADNPDAASVVRGPWWVVPEFLIPEVPGAEPPATGTPLDAILKKTPPGPEPIDRGADALALLLFTSGTTGSPKGVGLTHGNVLANLESLLVRTWEMRASDRLLHVLPPHHVHGLVLGIYGPLHTGGTAVMLERFDPVVVLRSLAAERISVLMGVPTMYHRMVEALDTDESLARAIPADSMRLFTCGSASLSPEIFHRFRRRFGFPIVERYGLTETMINASNPWHGPWKPGSVGLPLPGIEIGIFDEKGRRLGAGESGEICVRGPNVFREYWNNPEESAAAFREGWFRTGDLGAFDGDGYLFISGRIKDLIIVGGSNVTPGEVERVLESDPGVAECAVAGVPDPDLGERIVAFIVPREEAQSRDLESRLRKRAERDLAPYKRPRAYRFLRAIPRNAMGKVERNQLRDQESP